MDFSLSDVNSILGDIKNLDSFQEEILQFKNISIDSRKIKKSDLFIALKGRNFDGHSFLSQVIKKGVRSVVINEGMQNLIPVDFPCWVVKDTLEAFQKLTLFKRKKLNIPLVAITGSVGKTTTKEMMGKVLKRLGKIKLSYANFNNEIGVGLTILETDLNDDVLILEMGMRGLGQIENLSKYTEPDIAVITNIGSAHIGLLGSKENITYAKCEITRYLNPNGVVIIPANDLFLEKILRRSWKGRIIKVELIDLNSKSKNLLLKDDIIRGFYDQTNKKINIDEKFFNISLEGLHNARNFMFVYAVAKEFEINFNTFNDFYFDSLSGRNNILRSAKTTIYDESYNASPESVKACLKNLLEKPRNHFFIFGSMQELGEQTREFHKNIFDFINESDIKKCLFICNKEDEIYYSKYLKENEKFLFINEITHIAETINKLTEKGDSILIKGSRYWQLEKIIKSID